MLPKVCAVIYDLNNRTNFYESIAVTPGSSAQTNCSWFWWKTNIGSKNMKVRSTDPSDSPMKTKNSFRAYLTLATAILQVFDCV